MDENKKLVNETDKTPMKKSGNKRKIFMTPINT